MKSKQKWLLVLAAVIGLAAGYGMTAHALAWPDYHGYFNPNLVDGSHSGSDIWPQSGSTPAPSTTRILFGSTISVAGTFTGSSVGSMGCHGDGSLAIPNWVDTAQELIDFVECKQLFGNLQENTGANFIIGTVIGSADQNYVSNLFNSWTPFAKAINDAANNNQITWNHDAYVGTNSGGKAICPSGYTPNTYYKVVSGTSDVFPFSSNCGSTNMRFIEINTIGGTYHLKRFCANPMGDLPPIKTFNMSGTVLVNGQANVTLHPGDPMNFTYTLSNAPNVDTSSAIIWARGNATSASGPWTYDMSNVPIGTFTSGTTKSNFGADEPLTVPMNAVAGSKICRILAWFPDTPNNDLATSTPACVTVDVVATIYQPYLSVRGGDVAAGPGFGSGAACAPELSTITGNNLGSGNGYYGAGSELGVFSLGQNTNFASNTTLNSGTGIGSSSSGASALQPSGLAFSNNNAAGSIFGTAYGKSGWCASDYYGTADSGATSISVTTIDQTWLNNHPTNDVTYKITGNLTINGPITLGSGSSPKRIKLLVLNGDVTINNVGGAADKGIEYASYNYTSATGVSVVPQFQLLVKDGNIFVDKDVMRLNGFYHAQRSGPGTKGYFVTCATTVSGSPKYLTNTSGESGAFVTAYATTDGNYYTNCSRKLTVYGSVAAYAFKLNRSGGNLTTSGSVANTPAEQIIYGPELWLGTLRSTLPSTPEYDSITSLPPIL